jgi:hypothetical protein
MPERPILIAYDPSEDARSAVTRAGGLLTPGRALVATVWPAAERLVTTSAGAATYAPVFGEIDELERTNARAAAEQGCRSRARGGLRCQPARGALRSERVARDPRPQRAVVARDVGEPGDPRGSASPERTESSPVFP